MTFRVRVAVTTFVAGTALLLSGCAVPKSGFAVLEQDATARDAIPALLDGAGDPAHLESSRFAGEHEGASVWLMKTLDGRGVCMLVYPSETEWVIGCSESETGLEVGGPSARFAAVPDGHEAPPNTISISENVYAFSS